MRAGASVSCPSPVIVHVITNLRSSSGGPTTAVVELAREQAARGEAVRILCDEPLGEDGGAPGRWSDVDVRVFAPSGGPGGRGMPREEIGRRLAEVGPRVVHLHGVWDPILRRASAESARLGIPWVLSSHGMLHPFTLRRGFLKKRVYLGVFPGLVGSARAVLTLNREEADAVRRRFRVRAVIAPNGIDPRPYERTADGSFARSVPALGGRPFVLFLGRLDPIKGIDQLLAAYGLAASEGLAADLVIAGPDFGAERGLRSRVARLGLESQVHVIGPLSGALKLQALAECAVFAHRPRYEGFGLAVAEAMAAARPVVTTERCLLDGAAEAGAIRVVADDDRSFAKGLRDLADDVGGSRLLGMRAREWIRRELAWPAVIERIESGYRA